jgi:hypothetical protein
VRVALALGVLVGCSPPGPPQAPDPVWPADPHVAEAIGKLNATLARDGILLDTEPVIETCLVAAVQDNGTNNCARCEVATALDQIDPDLIDQMAIAFARWPSSLRKAAHLEHVAFCKSITYYGKKDHGPAGLADPNANRVYISVEYFRGAGTGFSIEATVHHEVFHLLDFQTQGRQWAADGEWQKLNPKGFAYRDPSVDIERQQGFVNGYASTDSMEDRASTFEYLMVRPDDLCTMSANDAALARKAGLLRKRVLRLEGAKSLGLPGPCKPAPKAKRPDPRHVTLPAVRRK